MIEQSGRKAVALPGDITDEHFCQKLVTDAVQSLNGLDILVNNAGVQTSYHSISEITTEHFDKVMKTNLYALFWITKAAVLQNLIEKHLSKSFYYLLDSFYIKN